MNKTLLQFVALCTLILSGCAQHPNRTPTPLISQNWPQHQTQVEALTAWQAVGKLGVKTPNDGGSVTLRWKQRGTGYQIDLNGPFGQGNITIEGSPGRVTFSGGGNPPQSAKTAEELMLKNTGWNIPLTHLTYWVRGLPDPNSQITHFTPNALGLLGELNQSGWKIIYSDYLNIQNTTDTLAMPGRIIAEYNEMRLTLLIREWKLGDIQ